MKSFKALNPITALAALLLLGGAQVTSSQPVYRCGNAYSQAPCPGAVAVDVDDMRTDAQRLASEQALAKDKTLARDMELSRHRDEAMALAHEKAAQSAAHKKRVPKKARAGMASQHSIGKRTTKLQDPNVFNTIVPGPTTKKNQAKAP